MILPLLNIIGKQPDHSQPLGILIVPALNIFSPFVLVPLSFDLIELLLRPAPLKHNSRHLFLLSVVKRNQPMQLLFLVGELEIQLGRVCQVLVLSRLEGVLRLMQGMGQTGVLSGQLLEG